MSWSGIFADAHTYTDNQGIGGRILQPVTSNILLLRHAVCIDGSGRLESVLTQTAPIPMNKEMRELKLV